MGLRAFLAALAAVLVSESSAIIIHREPPENETTYMHMKGMFGPQTFNATGPMVLVTPATLCSAPIGSLAGKVALVLRGGCSFVEKTVFAQQAGAVALVVGDVDDTLTHLRMSWDPGADPDTAIPAVLIIKEDYDKVVKMPLPLHVTVGSWGADNVEDHFMVNYGIGTAFEEDYYLINMERQARRNASKSPVVVDLSSSLPDDYML